MGKSMSQNGKRQYGEGQGDEEKRGEAQRGETQGDEGLEGEGQESAGHRGEVKMDEERGGGEGRVKRQAKSMEWALKTGRKRTSVAFYFTVRFLIKTLLWRFLRLEAKGSENIPKSGPAIVAPVHRSNLDAPLISGCTKRRFRALGKESLFVNPIVAWVCGALGSVPLKRGAADLEAVRATKEMLSQDELVLVFPEGSRRSGQQVVGVFDGVAYLSSKTGAPIVPIGIAGTEKALPSGAKFPKRTRVAISVGKALQPPEGRLSRPELSAFSAEVRDALQASFTEAQEMLSPPSS